MTLRIGGTVENYDLVVLSKKLFQTLAGGAPAPPEPPGKPLRGSGVASVIRRTREAERCEKFKGHF